MEAFILYLIAHPVLALAFVVVATALVLASPDAYRAWKRNTWTYYQMAFPKHGEVYYLRRNRLDNWEVRPSDCEVWCNADDGSVDYAGLNRTRTYVYTPKNACVRGLTGQIVDQTVGGFGWFVLEHAEAVPCSQKIASTRLWREPAYIV